MDGKRLINLTDTIFGNKEGFKPSDMKDLDLNRLCFKYDKDIYEAEFSDVQNFDKILL